MYERPLGPSITPLEHTSPTINEELRVCFLRTAFQSDERFSNIRFASTYASLGSIAHKLMELVTHGDFDGIGEEALDKAINKCWLELVQIEVQKFQDDVLSKIPEPVKWPKYALKMVASCKAASRIASQRQKQPIFWSASSPEKPKSEIWYEGYGGKLLGRIDSIRHHDSGVEVIDYKSGHIMEQDEIGGNTQRLHEGYKRQILLYAALVHENEGQWPIKLTMESLIDGSHMVDYTPIASEKTVEEALLLLDLYNQQAAINEIKGSPNEDNCRWCRYKALCASFLETADISWIQPSITVVGRVASAHLGSLAFITLDVVGGNYCRELINIRGIPNKIIPQLEKQSDCLVSFGNLKPMFGSKDLYVMWNSTFWRWLD